LDYGAGLTHGGLCPKFVVFLGFYVFIEYALIFLTRIDMTVCLQTQYVNTYCTSVYFFRFFCVFLLIATV